jgi:adenylate cyclase
VQSLEVGVLFADLVGFSRLAEMVTPEELIEMLRAFHHRMERAVFEHGGTLDKFLGDGVGDVRHTAHRSG